MEANSEDGNGLRKKDYELKLKGMSLDDRHHRDRRRAEDGVVEIQKL